MGKEKKKLTYEIESVFETIDADDSVFAPAKIMIGYCGDNRNYSSISEEVFMNASLDNIPVVGKFYSDKKDFGGHDMKIVEDKDNYDIYPATVPFGVVPKGAKTWFTEEVVDGENKKCFWTECLLWKRQYGYEYIAQAKTINHSMEIEANEYTFRDDGYTVVEDMKFTALCLLGKDIEPCFENSRLETFSLENFDENYKEMLKAFENYSLNLRNEVSEMETNEVINKTETTVEESVKKESIAEEPVVKEEPTVEELIVDEEPVNEESAVDEPTIEEPIAEEPTIDYALEYEKINQMYTEILKEVEELRKFKADIEIAEREKAESEIFAKFTKLDGIEAYTELKSKCKEYSLTDLEDKCYSIAGRNGINLCDTQEKENEAIKTYKFSVVNKEEDFSKPYGDAFEKY